MQKRFIDNYFWQVIAGLVVVGLGVNALVWFAPGREQEVSTVQELPSYPVEQVMQGRELYAANCATCHGANGAGYAQAGVPAPALNGTMHAWHHPDAQIAGFIRNGVRQMPAVGADWTDEEIDAVLSYVKQWWEPEQLAEQTERSAQSP